MKLWALAACLLALASAARALEVAPVANASLLGGQYFFKNERSSFAGNASALAAPVLSTSEQWSFVPMLASSYQGTKGVNDNVGAGTLFQQEMNHRVSFTAIDALPNSSWKLKPSISYKREFLKETLDEAWGHGLFDYDKIALGVELENIYKEPFSYRVGFDVFKIRYMNFQSLESQSGVDPLGNPLGRENAGSNVLDTYNYQISAGFAAPFPYDEPKVSLSGSYSLLYQDYGKEHIVNPAGQYKSSTRKDFLQSFAGGIGYPRPLDIAALPGARLDLSAGFNIAVNASNENTFDAAFAQYVDDSYSFLQYGFGPAAQLAWGDSKHPTTIGASIRWMRTDYMGRLAQNADGLYQNHEFQDRTQLGLNYAYPITPSMYLRVQTNFLWARSNNHFETTYAYNYTANNYLMGVTWEY